MSKNNRRKVILVLFTATFIILAAFLWFSLRHGQKTEEGKEMPLLDHKFYADLTHDGSEEIIAVRQESLGSRQGEPIPGFGSVSVYRGQDTQLKEPIWSWPIHYAGNTFLYLTKIEGEMYLLQYLPTSSSGIYTYMYKVFSLAGGEEKIYVSKEGGVWNETSMSSEEIDAEIDDFKTEMGKYLKNAVTLMELGTEYTDYRYTYRYCSESGEECIPERK